MADEKKIKAAIKEGGKKGELEYMVLAWFVVLFVTSSLCGECEAAVVGCSETALSASMTLRCRRARHAGVLGSIPVSINIIW